MAFTPNDDINILQASDSLNVGAGGGNDRYILSSGQLTAGQVVNITDAQGANTLHLVGGLTIASSIIANNALQLTLSNGAVVNVFGADDFSYLIGGDALSGTGGTTQNYSSFVTSTLGASSVPATGTVQGNLNVTIGGGGGTPPPVSLGNVFTLDGTIDGQQEVLLWDGLSWDGASYTSILDFLTEVAGLDFNELGIDISQITDVGEIWIDAYADGDGGNITDNTITSTITFNLASGDTVTADTSAVGVEYLQFLKSLVFDANGNSRLTTETVTTDVEGAVVLTTTENNGGTFEPGFTTGSNDTIFVGRPELIHGAYIDTGAGYDIMEVDMKGPFAQPLQLLNLEEIRVQNLPNVYDAEQGNDGFEGTNSALDLSRATSLQKLVITEGRDFSANGNLDVELGDLTIVGIRNNATARLEGGFTKDVTLHYGQGVGSQVNVELQLGSVDVEQFHLNVAHNASVLHFDSQGFENSFLGGRFGDGNALRKLVITGPAALFIEEPLEGFNDMRPAIIDARGNTGGVELTLAADWSVQEGDAAFRPTVTFYGSAGNDEFTALRYNTVTIDGTQSMIDDVPTSGNDKYVVSAYEVNIKGGAGNDHITLSGLNVEFDLDSEDDISPIDDEQAPGMLLNIDAGTGNNTIVLGRDVAGNQTHDNSYFGVTALAGSSITGENITLIVENNSDLTQASLQGITSVVMRDDDNYTPELRITAEQFAQLGAGVFSTQNAAFGNWTELLIVVSEDTVLSDLVDLSQLSNNVKLQFEITNGAVLTLTAEQLHKYVSENGIEVAGELGGQVVVTGAGLNFNVFDNDEFMDDTPFDGGDLSEAVFVNGINLTVIRSVNGFERPEPTDSTDTLTIDTTGDEALVVSDPIRSVTNLLEIVGDQDIVFEAPVNLGNNFVIDFSDLAGSVTGLTVEDFQDVNEVIGNNTGTRIDVELDNGSEVGAPGNANGLKTSGVATYVVTDIVDVDNGSVVSEEELASHATIYLCDLSQDVETVGLQGNFNDTLNVLQVNWGVNFLLEAGGDAKADGNPNYANIGSLHAEYFWAGEGAHADSIVTINNQGVAADRPIHVAGIDIDNADSITVNAEDGDVVIESLDGNSVDDLTFTSVDDITVRDLNGLELATLDASGVDGDFTIELGNDLDLSGTAVSGVDAIVFTDAAAALTLTLEQVDAIGVDNISVAAGVDGATLNLVGLGEDPFVAPDVAEGIVIGTVTVAAQAEVTLDPDTDLTGIDALIVPEGTTLNLTAEQFQQLGTGVITGVDADGAVSTDFTVNVTDLAQANIDVDADEDGNADGIDLSGITADTVTVALAESVNLNADTDLGTASVIMDDDQTLGLATEDQANERVISGGTNTTVEFQFIALSALTQIDASGYDIDTLRVDDDLVAGQNVEYLLQNLSSDVLVQVTDFLEPVDPINREVEVLPGVQVNGELVFNDVQPARELVTLMLTMLGGSEIVGPLRLPTVDAGALDAVNFQTLTINSQGDEPNILSDINGVAVPPGNPDPTLEIENNLLNVVINAEQDLTVGDITFSSIDDSEAVANLTVNGAGDVVIHDLNTRDADVTGLNVTHTGTGSLEVRVDGWDIDGNEILSIAGSATGTTNVVINDDVDLSEAALSNIASVVLEDGAELTLTYEQFDGVGTANFSVAETGDDADLHIVDLGEDPADFGGLAEGITVATVTIVEQDEVTLDPTTDLTGVQQLIVLDGTQLTMSAAQFKQLVEAGATIDTNTSGSVIVDLNGDLTIGADDEATIDGSDVTFAMADGEVLNVETFSMADGLQVTGDDTAVVKPLVNFTFETNPDTASLSAPDFFETIDVGAYQDVDLRILDALLDNFYIDTNDNDTLDGGENSQSIEDLLADMANANILNIYQEAVVIELDPRDRVVVVEPEASPDGIEFSAVGSLADYVRSIDLTLQANADNAARIDGNVYVNDGQVRTGYTMLTINTDDLSGADPLTADPVTIDGQILSDDIAAGDAGEFLSLTINANDVDLVVTGAIIFNSDTPDSEVTVTITGNADVTLKDLDTTDTDITGISVVTTGYTGTLTITGGSDALELNDTQSLTFVGGGNIVLDTSDSAPEDDNVDNNHGIQGNSLTSIDLSDFTGTIDLGVIQQVSSTDFTFTAGDGNVSLTLGGSDTLEDGMELDVDGDAEAPGWTFNLGANTTMTITDQVTFTEGPLAINGDGTVVIEGIVDLRNLVDGDGNSLLDFGANVTVELAEGAGLLMTDEQWDALPAAVQTALTGDGQTLDLTDADVIAALTDAGVIVAGPLTDLTELRGISELILPEDGVAPGDITMTSAQAAVAYTVDAGGVRSTWDHDNDGGTAEVAIEDGNLTQYGANVTVMVAGDDDLSGLVLDDGGAGTDAIQVEFESLPALSLSEDQADILIVETDALGATSAAAVDIFAALDSLTVEVVYGGAFDQDTGDEIFTPRDIEFTITRDVGGNVTDVSATGHAAAMGSAQNNGTGLGGLLEAADNLEFTFVGTLTSINNGPLDAYGVNADSSFVFIETAGDVATTEGDEIDIVNFNLGAVDSDALDFSAFLGANYGYAGEVLDGSAGTAAIVGDVVLYTDAGDTLFGALAVADFGTDFADFDGKAVVLSQGGAANHDFVNIYYVDSSLGGVANTVDDAADIQLVGTVTSQGGVHWEGNTTADNFGIVV